MAAYIIKNGKRKFLTKGREMVLDIVDCLECGRDIAEKIQDHIHEESFKEIELRKINKLVYQVEQRLDKVLEIVYARMNDHTCRFPKKL